MSNCERCPALRVTFTQKYWISEKSVGGSERGVERRSRALGRLNVPVTVLTCGDYARGKQHPPSFNSPDLGQNKTGVMVREIPSMQEIADTIDVSDPRDIGVLHMVWGFEHFPDSLSKCLDKVGVPKVFNTVEIGHFEQITQELDDIDAKRKYIENMCQKVDCLVAISQPLAQEAKNIGFPNVRTIYTPVPDYIFSPADENEKRELRLKSNLPLDKKIGLFAGRLVREKGIGFLMDGFNTLSEISPNNWHLIVAGGIDNSDPLYNKFQEFSSRQDVDYLGVLTSEKSIANLMKLSDVFIYPTVHKEGLALSVAEAMSCGLPVVTTEYAVNETGTHDLVIPGETGLTFNHRSNPSALLSDILYKLDKKEICRLGMNARKRIYDLKIDEQQVGNQLRELYCELQKRYGNCPEK